MDFDSQKQINDDPSVFGQRFLEDDKAVFEFNAWDNVDWPEEKEKEALLCIETQKLNPVDKTEVTKLTNNPEIKWDEFYQRHDKKFFMDRKWLVREFPEIFERLENQDKICGLDVGCGVGNALFPLLSASSKLFMHCCDYSPTAINLVHNNPLYSPERANAFVWDITESTDEVSSISLDFVLCIYVLSAISPDKQEQAIHNLIKLLKPGGLLLIKDYAQYDLTQLRFKKNRLIDDNFYCRGDGTLVYFFSNAQLHEILEKFGMEKIQNFLDKRLIVNRAKKIQMYRRWIQCKYNKKKLLKLCCETAKNRHYLEKILDNVPLFVKQPGIDGNPYMALVILYEILIGNGVKECGNKLKAAAIRFTNSIEREVKRLKAEGYDAETMVIESKATSLPRYARINTLKTTKNECIEVLQKQGKTVIFLKKTILSKVFKTLVEKLALPKVYVDPHIENLLIFPRGTDLHANELVTSGCLILQDKVCAAPGNKTSHLAAVMQNKGKIFATDRDAARTKTLTTYLKHNGVKIADVKNEDFLKIDVSNKRYQKVSYAVVDPPCSGSGIAKRGEFFDEFEEPDPKRIRSLANLQHALKLPNLKRLVYSTCSKYAEENEGVISDVLNDSEIAEHFQLRDPLPQWKHRGIKDEDYKSFAHFCLRADPEKDLTNGFFVALFERI